MTFSTLYHHLKEQYGKEKGERFFSFSLLWSCLCEKQGLSPSLSFSPKECLPSLSQALFADAAALLGGMPLQYYLGKWEFRGHDYLCREQVLIPREDTALLCELCEKLLPPQGKLLDFCCGSGIVGISVLLNRPDCRGISADVSPHALALTRDNAALHGVEGRLQVKSLDLFSPETEELLAKEAPSVFACNPPYIPGAMLDSLEDNVKQEPSLALDGGEDGLDFYRRILQLSLTFPHIAFACEMGFDQKEALTALFAEHEKQASFFRDFSGNDRAFVFENVSL